MTETPSERSAGFQALTDNRWVILFFSVLSMVAVANFQYGWTLFVGPLQKHLNVEVALIQVTFTVFVLLETWLVPFEGWLVDKFGPKLLVMIGGVLAGAGWYGSGKAETLSALYISYAISGLGRWRGVRHGDWKRAQVVPRSPRTCGRSNSCGLRSRVGFHGRTPG